MKKIQQFLTLGLLFGAASLAQAQTVSPNPAPTIITSAPYTITTSGYYQLGANINVTNTSGNIITIAVANVTLDFAGHYISGPTNAVTTSTLYGVGSVGYANLIIQNGTISHCYEGINLNGANGSNGSDNYNQLVQNMLVTNTGHIGVNLYNALNSRVINSVITNIGGATAANGTGNFGIYLLGGGGFTIDNNVISGITGPSNDSGDAYGIFVYSGTSLVSRNKIYGAYYGLYYTGYASGKYQDNLTIGTTSSFNGGTDAGGNN